MGRLGGGARPTGTADHDDVSAEHIDQVPGLAHAGEQGQIQISGLLPVLFNAGTGQDADHQMAIQASSPAACGGHHANGTAAGQQGPTTTGDGRSERFREVDAGGGRVLAGTHHPDQWFPHAHSSVGLQAGEWPRWRRDEGVTRRKGEVDAAGAAPLRACVGCSLAATGGGGCGGPGAGCDLRATARPLMHKAWIVAPPINSLITCSLALWAADGARDPSCGSGPGLRKVSLYCYNKTSANGPEPIAGGRFLLPDSSSFLHFSSVHSSPAMAVAPAAAWVIVAGGGRDLAWPLDQVRSALLLCSDSRPVRQLFHGAARGADQAIAIAAQQLGWPVAALPADWQRHGPAAGPIRNRWWCW